MHKSYAALQVKHIRTMEALQVGGARGELLRGGAQLTARVQSTLERNQALQKRMAETEVGASGAQGRWAASCLTLRRWRARLRSPGTTGA